MVFSPAWRRFKRTQDLTVVMGGLIYAGAVLHAFERLPLAHETIMLRTLVYPAAYLIVALGAPLAWGWLRRRLTRYVWMSFEAGFGQTLFSVVSGVLLLGGAAAFMYWKIGAAQSGDGSAAGVFSAFAAGVGILAAQAVLARTLERDPAVRAKIET